MIVAIHQPNFLPHKGFFDKIEKADLFILLDHVQYSKGSYTNRVLIDDKQYISLPVTNKGSIKDLEVFNPEKSYAKLYKTIQQSKINRKELVLQMIENSSISLMNFNIRCILKICEELGIVTPILRSSYLTPEGDKNQLLINLVKRVGGDTYLTNRSDYLDEKMFEQQGIKIMYFNSMENSNGKSIITQW